ncbi:MAG: hypothetical protein AB9828_08210 [Sphaerochaetaceae bacterium]
MDILIVHDKLPASPSKDELDTMVEVAQVTRALRANGHHVMRSAFSLNLATVVKRIGSYKPQMVFNLVETLHGSRLIHLAPALFEALRVPFTGGGSQGMYLSSNKLLAKRLMRLAGIPTPEWVEDPKTADLSALLGSPLIVKPIAEEASVGINDDSVRVFNTRDELEQAFSTFGPATVFAERFIDGREFNISILPIKGVPQVLPPAEMCFLDYPLGKPAIAGYEAKWEESSFAYTHTQRNFAFGPSDSLLIGQLKDLSLRCWELFGSQGYARVDFRVDSRGVPYVLELNVNPCIAEDSGFTAAAQVAGMTHMEMIERIVQG